MAARKKKKKPPSQKEIRRVEQLSFEEVGGWEIPPVTGSSVEIDSLPSPIWTETKAQLIAHYLRLFLMITKHGAYIDGFAGPQDKSNPDSWSAKLVIELLPQWMKSFFLCEVDSGSYADLVSMLEAQPPSRGRKIQCKNADFNHWVDEAPAAGQTPPPQCT